jgi:hypothetical protein
MLQSAVYGIHKHLPEYDLIIYDLGLTEEQYKTVTPQSKLKNLNDQVIFQYKEILNFSRPLPIANVK